MTAIGPPHNILIAPEDEPCSARLAVLSFCTSLALAAVVALIAWHVAGVGRASVPVAPHAAAQPLAATAVSTEPGPSGTAPVLPAAPAVVPNSLQPPAASGAVNQQVGSAVVTAAGSATAATASPGLPLILQALARMDLQAPPDTLTVFVVATAEQVDELEQGLRQTNAGRARSGLPPLRTTVVSAAADPEAFWLALAHAESEPYVIVDLR